MVTFWGNYEGISQCHAPIAADHYTVNTWPSIAKGMGARTSMSENELDILTRYFQYNAKDITEKQ